MASVWKTAFFAALPWFVMGGCNCNGSQGCFGGGCDVKSQGCGSFSETPVKVSECVTSLDCAAFDEDCRAAACEEGKCVFVLRPNGTAPPDAQTEGDCVTQVCSGGSLVAIAALDPPSPDDPCQVGTCQDRLIVIETSPDGADCSLDGGSGYCVGGRCLHVPESLGGPDAGAGGGQGTGGADAGTGGGTGTGGDAGMGGAPACIGCAEAISGAEPARLCPSSQSAYDDLVDCICVVTCEGDCAANLCASQPITAECASCVTSVDAGCGTPLTACNDDY